MRRQRASEVVVDEFVGVEVEDVEERLGRQQVELAQVGQVDAGRAERVVPPSRILPAASRGLQGGLAVLVVAGLLLEARDRLLDGLHVGEDQLGVDRLDVAAGLDAARRRGHVGVG